MKSRLRKPGEYGMRKLDCVRNPVFIIVISLIAGILISYYFLNPASLLWCLPFLLSLIALAPSLFKATILNDKLMLAQRISFMAFFFLGVGMLATSIATPEEVKIEGKTECMIEGRVEEIASRTTGDRILLSIDRFSDNEGNVHYNPGKAYISTGPTSLCEGDIIRLKADLIPAGSNSNYQKTSGQWLRNNHIFYSAYVDENEIMTAGHSITSGSLSRSVRDDIEIFVEKTPLNQETKNFIISLLLGDKQAMSRETRNDFSNAGVAHILAVSGMHIGIISSVILLLLFPVSLFWNHKAKYLISLPLIWSYVWLTGMAPSTVRAATMISFFFIAILLERKHNTISALGWAALLILVFDPFSLFDVGFQLSFVCVFFILLLNKEINFVDRQRHPRLYNLTSVVLLTIVASLATWSIISLYFGKVVTLFLPANLIVVPLLPLFVTAVLAYLILSLLGLEAGFLADIIDGAYEYGVNTIRHISTLGSVENLQVGLPAVFLWLGGLLIIGLLLKYKEKKKLYWIGGTAILCLSVLSIPVFQPPREPDGFIIQKSFPYITMASYAGNEESVITMPKGKISTLEHSGKKILILDGSAEHLNITEELAYFLSETDLVVVGSGFKGNGEKLLSYLNREATCLMHSTLTQKKEEKLTKGFFKDRKIYSMRSEGPYHSFIGEEK